MILDGTDNFETRYLLNDFAVKRGIPWVYGAAVGSYGLKMSVVPGQTPCLRCVYPEPPGGAQPTCETAGVLGPVTAAIASLQGRRCAADPGRRVIGHRRSDHDGGRVVGIRSPDPCRSARPRVPLLRPPAVRVPGRIPSRAHKPVREERRSNSRTVAPARPRVLGREPPPAGDVRLNEFALRAWIDGYELTVFPDGRAIIKGTTDVGLARSLYARYIGA